MTFVLRGSIATDGSFCRPREIAHSLITSSVYALPVASVYALTYPPAVSFVRRTFAVVATAEVSSAATRAIAPTAARSNAKRE